MRQSILFFIFLASLACLNAQTKVVLPVRENGKWGYINQRGKVLIAPRYDAIGDKNAPFHGQNALDKRTSNCRLVSVGDSCGLLDKTRKELFAPKYEKVLVLADTLFALKKDGKFWISGIGSAPLLDISGYDDVSLPQAGNGEWTDFFMVKKNGFWGGILRNGAPLIDPVYTRIVPIKVGKGFFKVEKNNSGKWQLLDDQNKLVFQKTMDEIRVCDPNFFIYRIGRYWYFSDRNGNVFYENEIDILRPLNKDFVVFKEAASKLKEGKVTYFKLFSIAEKKIVSENALFESFDDQHVLAMNSNGERFLLDEKAQRIGKKCFYRYKPLNEQICLVSNANNRDTSIWTWGIYNFITDTLLIRPCYTEVMEYQDSIAIVSMGGKKGAINYDGTEILPPLYQELYVEDNFLKATTDSSLVVIAFSGNGKLGKSEEFRETYTIQVNESDLWSEPDFVKQKKVGESRDISEYYRWGQKNNPPSKQWKWVSDTLTHRYGLCAQRDDEGMDTLLPAVYKYYQNIEHTYLVLVFKDENPISNEFTRFLSKGKLLFCRAALYDYQLEKFITGFDFLGLRRHDFESRSPLAVTIDTAGKMGLIDIKGHEIKDNNEKPLRASYIEEFSWDGRARVCLNGKLKEADDDERRKGFEMLALEDVFGFTATRKNMYSYQKVYAVHTPDSSAQRWGYIDTLGHFFIEPQYEHAQRYNRNGMICQKGGLWGVINKDGKEVIPFKYRWITNLGQFFRVFVKSPITFEFDRKGNVRKAPPLEKSDKNLLPIQKEGLWGFSGGKGIEAVYNEVRPFSEGLAMVRRKNALFFVDTTGQQVVQVPANIRPSDVYDFHSGLCRFKAQTGYGFLDKTGKTVVLPTLSMAEDFNNGVSIAAEKTLFGVLDTAGKWLLSPKFAQIKRLNGVFFAVKEQLNGNIALFDRNGTPRTPFRYQQIDAFKDGFATFKIANRSGLMDENFKEIIEPKYQDVKALGSGLFALKPAENNYFILADSSGKAKAKQHFDFITPFARGTAWAGAAGKNYLVKQNGAAQFILSDDRFLSYSEGFLMLDTSKQMGNYRFNRYIYLNEEGDNIFRKSFADAKPFQKGVASVKVIYFWGVINRFGLYLVPPKYGNFETNPEGFTARVPTRMGLFDKTGRQLLSPEYDRIELTTNGFFRVELGDKVGYARGDGSWVWELKE